MTDVVLTRRWHTVAEVAEMLGYGETKVRMAILSGRPQVGEGRQAPPDPARVGGRVRRAQGRGVRGRPLMARRHNGEGTIYPYRNGYAAQVWVTTPQGRRERKTVYGKTREVVHDKWVQLQEQARRGPVTTKVPRLEEFAVGWLRDVVSPNLAPTTAANYELFTRLYIVPDLGMQASRPAERP